MKRVIHLIFLILISFSMNSYAQIDTQVSKTGITAAPFLEIGVGARANAMGGAFVGTADDASALYWNVAGIARVPGAEGVFMHINWLADISFDYVGMVVPAGPLGSFGLSIASMSMDDMLVRTEDRPLGTGEYFQTGSLALGVSYAINLTDRFSIGMTGKYIREQIWKEVASSVAFDIGTLFTTDFNGMRIGAALSNFGSDMRMHGEDLIEYHDIDANQLGNNDKIFAELQTDEWPLPLTFQVGVAMEVWQNDFNRLTVAMDAVQPTDNMESINLGLEYAMKEWMFLRGGYRDLFIDESEEGLTLGAGANLSFLNIPVRLDYSYADFGRLQDVQAFAISMRF